MIPSVVAAVVVAGGSGERFGRGGGKQLVPVGGRPLLAWTVDAVCGASSVSRTIVVCPADRVQEYRDALGIDSREGQSIDVVAGGGSRQESVSKGLAALPHGCDVVVVHDGARPLLPSSLFDRTVDALRAWGCDGVVVGHPSVDTLKVVECGVVTATADRTVVWAVQTPQAFETRALIAAHELARREGFTGTDDASLVEWAGGEVRVIDGPLDNIKVTHPEDLAMVESLLVMKGMGERAC